jgi:dipeptidyl-peptidase-4
MNPSLNLSSRTLLVALMLILPTHAALTADGPDFSIDRFYSLPHLPGTTPSAPAWRKDGRVVAFLWNDNGYDFRDIWSFDLDSGELERQTDLAGRARTRENARGLTQFAWDGNGGLVYALRGDLYHRAAGGDSRRLTDTPAAESRLAVSSTGQLSFVRDGDLWVADLDAADLADASRRVVAKDFKRQYVERHAWSPDGNQIAFVTNDLSNVPLREFPYYANGENRVRSVTRPFPGDQTSRRRIGLVEVESGDVRWLEHPAEHPVYTFAWSSDSETLMVDSSDFFLELRSIRTYDAATGEATLFYEEEESKQVNPAWSAAWAPGDRGLIILSDRNGWYHLFHKTSPRARPKQLTRGEWEVSEFSVDGAGQQIYFLANRDHPGERQLYRVALGGGGIEQVGEMPGTHAPTFSPDYAYAADIISNDATPPDLYLASLGAKPEETRLTTSPLEEFTNYTWAETRYFTFESAEGTELVARVTLPPNFDESRRYPMIVGSVYSDSVRRQWGGRTSHPTWGLDQVLAHQGYIVFNVNVSGSWGQGKAHRQRLVDGLYGNVDIDDLESGVEFMVAEGYADPERVGIWGSSYGGLMTLMSLFKKPGLYAAGIAGAPASNVWHAYPGQMWTLGKTVHDSFEQYARQAAQQHAEGLEDPLMIIHGNADVVVLYGDSLDLASRLIDAGKTFELVTLPGGSHAWDVDNLTQTRFSFHKMLEFFDRHLKR